MGLELICDIDPQLMGAMIGDPAQAQTDPDEPPWQCYQKFTEKGEVVITVSKGETWSGEENKIFRTIAIAVSDTGIGISKEKIEQIFERFTQADSSTTRNYGGTGLGLTIAKNLAELMGGSLEVQSEQGKGSVFYPADTTGSRRGIRRGADAAGAAGADPTPTAAAC